MRRARGIGVAVVAMTLCGAARTGAQLGQAAIADSLMKLRTSVAFAFQARIDSLHASTVKAILPSQHTVAVTALSMLQCPTEVGQFDASAVTVWVDDTTGLAPGQNWWFFARGWIAGHGLGVREVSRLQGSYVDSVMADAYLGPTDWRARIERRIVDSVSILTGRIALDSARRNYAGRAAQLDLWRTLPLTITGILSDATDSVGSTVKVGVPGRWLQTVSLFQVPDSAQHLMFFLHSADAEPGRVFVDGRPKYVLRDSGDVRTVADSARTALAVTKIMASIALPGHRPMPRCGFPP